MASHFTTYLGSVTFTATTDAWSEPAESDVEVMGFPGGDSVAVSISGQRGITRTFKALLDSVDEFRAPRDMRAKEGLLFVETWDDAAVPAVLTSVRPEPPHISGEVSCTTHFILY